MKSTMKTIISILLALSTCFALAACGSSENEETTGTTQPTVLEEESSVETEGTETPDAAQNTEESNAEESDDAQQTEDSDGIGTTILVAYFSRTGENYNVGYIEKGNTHIVADMIEEQVGADMFEISTVTPYPDDYDECTESARQEQSENARPELNASVENMQDYDIIFLGYPNWWGDMPMAVYTFLESYDFSGKTIVPFCTHEGSGLSSTERSIASTCSGAEVLDGLAIRGSVAQNSQDQAQEAVIDWLKEAGFID